MAKIDRILQLLETRIARGDYAMTLFPTEHGLADEMQVGRMTARRAILRLAEKGLLHRDSSGRMVVTTQRSEVRPLQIGFVTATLSTAALNWQQAAQHSVRELNGHMRVITYFHWDDPTLLDATESFDGVFLIPPAEALPPALKERLLASRAHLVMLGADYSSQGLHSLDIISPHSVEVLLEHLTSLGHQHIAVLNTQPEVASIQDRLDRWSSWTGARNVSGELINEPEASYGDPLDRAYRVMKERLDNGQGFGGTAVLCTTLPAALGLMRAANESGLSVGRDVSICTVNDEGLGPFLNPTLTCTRSVEPRALLDDCLRWMAGSEWEGPLLKGSVEVELFVGGSTGPAPDSSSLRVPSSNSRTPFRKHS